MRTGLRTEIILSISLLLAAALLFAGFLMVKLTEHSLLDQKRAHAAGLMQLVAAGVDEPAPVSRPGNDLQIAIANLDRLQTVLSKQTDIIAWRLLDTNQQVLSSTAYKPTTEFTSISPAVLQRDELFEELSYETFQFFVTNNPQRYLDLSTSLWAGNEPYGLLQIRFSLDELQQRVQDSQRLILIYVIIYGLILAAFAVYLLNRNIVKPVRQLHRATAKVASGTLAPVNVLSGPGEIHELADSFNQMVVALTASRIETEEYIASLERTNQALAQARDELVRSEKLATVGYLAAGMAHEIGNPLAAVVGYLNILKDDLSGGCRDLVERSLVETGRIDRLVRQLLEYSAPVDHCTISFCPTVLLRETVELLRHQGQLEGLEIVDESGPGDCLVTMDRGRLMQVWINLLLNAQAAMPDKGRITLSSKKVGHNIRISILDDGEGIDPAVADRIFEPFFTTKAPGSGYGLGLAVCQRIVDEGGGSIEAVSDAGRGTCFTVTLPCRSEESL